MVQIVVVFVCHGEALSVAVVVGVDYDYGLVFSKPIFRIRSAAKLRNGLLKGQLPESSNCFAARDHCVL
ncbi:MAG: hypothetical protein AB1700_05215 [Bacillota bacterium]